MATTTPNRRARCSAYPAEPPLYTMNQPLPLKLVTTVQDPAHQSKAVPRSDCEVGGTTTAAPCSLLLLSLPLDSPTGTPRANHPLPRTAASQDELSKRAFPRLCRRHLTSSEPMQTWARRPMKMGHLPREGSFQGFQSYAMPPCHPDNTPIHLHHPLTAVTPPFSHEPHPSTNTSRATYWASSTRI
jgi:hypothetical protein